MLWIRLQIRKPDLGSGSPIPVWPPKKSADILSGGLKASLTFRRPATRPEKKLIAFFKKTTKKMSNCELFATFGYKKNCVCIGIRMHNTGFECFSCIFIDVFL
jgi:hypothetical protein